MLDLCADFDNVNLDVLLHCLVGYYWFSRNMINILLYWLDSVSVSARILVPLEPVLGSFQYLTDTIMQLYIHTVISLFSRE